MKRQNEIMHKLLDIMCSGNNVVLSKKGKEELSECIKSKEETDKYYNIKLPAVTWTILALKCDDTLELCSSYHDIVGGVSLDCIEI